MQTIYVKPGTPKGAKEPLNVRMPEREYKHMPEYGAPVPKNAYYLRLLRVGDVVETTEAAITKAMAAAKKPAADKSGK